ncbi:unnamed protein product [Vitrella brassicaformis CCMP3155]|uniref:Uncharacterized protein n=1 Tax=Vitrella brassicaformis (strain CCMP3155) TaxID=1169540 RepID=A0A0G4EFS2_VITBC|nr:unnamed protein product [Vitrella brassicaformis CCMP3155]|eukprot:CEL94225.1 unnamed protein product [Vitrella brassicaformis CCMP3155]
MLSFSLISHRQRTFDLRLHLPLWRISCHCLVAILLTARWTQMMICRLTDAADQDSEDREQPEEEDPSREQRCVGWRRDVLKLVGEVTNAFENMAMLTNVLLAMLRQT